MKQSAGIIVTFGAALACGIVVSAEPAPEPAVVGEELTGITAAGVTGVFWTRRQDHFTLQIQFNTPPGSNRLNNPAVASPASSADNPYPDVRVQLLDSSGAQIPHLRRLAVSPSLQAQAVSRGAPDGARRSEVIYTFPLSAGEYGDSIKVQIDGRDFMQKLPRM